MLSWIRSSPFVTVFRKKYFTFEKATSRRIDEKISNIFEFTFNENRRQNL